MAPKSERKPIAWIFTVLAGITLLVFWRVSGFEFTNYDDGVFVYDNPHVNAGLSTESAWWGLSTSYFDFWHPVTWWSHMLDCELFGLNADWHHLVSLGLHICSVLLLFWLLNEMTGTVWRSAVVAALFALHPLHVESVAWVAERKDVLSTLFGLLSIWAYVKWVKQQKKGELRTSPARRSLGGGGNIELPTSKQETKPGDSQGNAKDRFDVGRSTLDVRRSGNEGGGTPNPENPTSHFSLLPAVALVKAGRTSSWLWYGLALVFFALALMSKAMLVTLPFVLLLLDFWPLGRFGTSSFIFHTSSLLSKLPFFALSAASCAITYLGMSARNNILSSEKAPWALRLANVPVSYVRYLGKTFWPVDLAALYPMPNHLPAWQVWSSAALLMAITALCLLALHPIGSKVNVHIPQSSTLHPQFSSLRFLPVGWFWFLGTLVPVIGIVANGLQSIADRYMYIPSIGIFVAVVWGAADLSARWKVKPIALAPVTAGVLIVCGLLTWRQLGYWKDSLALWGRCLAVTHDNATAEYNMGVTLRKLGRTNEFLPHLERAVQISPGYEDAANLGVAFAVDGQLEKATNYFALSLRLKPDYVKALEDFGWALLGLRDYPGTIVQCGEAARLDPNSTRAWSGLAQAYAAMNKPNDAARCYTELCRLAPDSVEAHFQLATMLDAAGRKAEAVSEYRQVLSLNPDHLGALNNLAWLLSTAPDERLRDGKAAVPLAEHACELTGYGQTVLVGTLATAYAESGAFEKATETALKASKLADSLNQTNLMQKNLELAELFKKGQAYHEK